MNLEQLRYFKAVVQEKSINAASKTLHISSQALSRTLINLENALEVTLFERSRHGTMLTPQGQRLLLAVDQFLDALEHLDEDPLEKGFAFDNPCELLSSPGLEHFFPSFLAQIYRSAPDIQFKIRYNTYYHILDEVEHNVSEIALTNISLIDEHSIYNTVYEDLLFYPLFKYYFYCIASIKSPLAAYKTVSCKTLLSHAVVCIGSDLNHSTMSFIRQLGTPQKVIWEPHANLAYSMVGANLGITLGYAPAKSPLPPARAQDLVNLPLKESIVSIFGYVIKKDAPLSRNTQELIRFLHNIMPTLADTEPMKI